MNLFFTEENVNLTINTMLKFHNGTNTRAKKIQGAAYTEYQRQCFDATSNVVLMKSLSVLNKPRQSLQKWVATPNDQI